MRTWKDDERDMQRYEKIGIAFVAIAMAVVIPIGVLACIQESSKQSTVSAATCTGKP